MMQEDVDASDYAISNAIGASRHQIQCGKDRVEELLTKQTTVTASFLVPITTHAFVKITIKQQWDMMCGMMHWQTLVALCQSH
mmetsp:Transcript_24827/g.42533  ORF Transcript_24827/g.42533 Transcript_24827/m.42533 type:complete len:83 (+) Transcript_24827:350-598(+)